MYFKYYYRIGNDIIRIHWQKASGTLAYDADDFLWNLYNSDWLYYGCMSWYIYCSTK